MELRPQSTIAPVLFVADFAVNDFRFNVHPTLYDPRRAIEHFGGDSGDETEDEEERIKTSWHHRALLGDEGRIPYVESDAEEDVSAVSDESEDEDVVVFTNVNT